jgi:hypothetical protein
MAQPSNMTGRMDKKVADMLKYVSKIDEDGPNTERGLTVEFNQTPNDNP